MKNSEIGHYWMARELTDIEVLERDPSCSPDKGDRGVTRQIHLSTQFPTANFTLALDTPVRHIQVNGWDLREVRSRRDFQRDTFLVEGNQQTFVAFDLEVGETELVVTE